MHYPNLAVLRVFALCMVALAVIGVVCRHEVFFRDFVRRWPGRKTSILLIALSVVGIGSMWYRGTSTAAHHVSIGACVTLLAVYATAFRPTAPTAFLFSGIAGNMLVMMANGLRMPSPAPCGIGIVHTCTDDGTILRWLSDFIVIDWVGAEPYASVSPGDVAIGIGFTLMAYRLWTARAADDTRVGSGTGG